MYLKAQVREVIISPVKMPECLQLRALPKLIDLEYKDEDYNGNPT